MADQMLFDAIKEDDSTDIKQLLANYEGELQESGITWENNPLFTACNYGSVHCAKKMLGLKPELASMRNPENYSAMHFICENGPVSIVEALVKHDPELCLLRDGQFRTPLHIAVMKGKEDIIRALIMACPASLKTWTSLQETPLHLSLKTNQPGCFGVLMEEVQNLKLEEVLNWKDHEGNTVVHIATLHKQVQILELLLDQSPNGPLVQVNSSNRRGLTALDLHYQNYSNMADKDISRLLHEAGAERHFPYRCGGQPSNSQLSRLESAGMTRVPTQEGMSSMTRSVLLAVFIFVAGAVYASLFDLNNIYQLDQQLAVGTVRIEDIISAPDILPEVFYFMVFNTFTFLGSMIVILMNTWALVSKWSLCYRAVPLFVMGAMFCSYAVVVRKIVPKFCITIGSYKISSFWFVWIYDVPAILSIVTMWLTVKLILFIISKLRKGAEGNKTNNQKL